MNRDWYGMTATALLAESVFDAAFRVTHHQSRAISHVIAVTKQ
jgi:hypothetical protein